MKLFSSFRFLPVFYFSIFLLSYFSIAIPISFAQFNTGLVDSDISVTVSPENPGPNQNVTITIDSFATDLNSASITWAVNGKNVLVGKGKKQLSLTVGAIGTKTNIQITIDTVAGTVIKSFSIIPSSVDMIWQANTYTPPFFKGRPLYSPESSVTFIAVPHMVNNGVETSPKNLIYKWSNNGTVLGDQSGYGVDRLTIYGSILPRPLDITVEATDPVTGNVANGESALSSQQPFVLIYKNDPLYGVQYEKALQGTFNLRTDEVDVVAVPYYYSTDAKGGANMVYTWEINGMPITDGINGANKVFRRVGDVFGTSNISVSVAQSNTLFQTSGQSFLINFQK